MHADSNSDGCTANDYSDVATDGPSDGYSTALPDASAIYRGLCCCWMDVMVYILSCDSGLLRGTGLEQIPPTRDDGHDGQERIRGLLALCHSGMFGL